MRARQAFVDVGTRDTVARVPRGARADERAREVGAVGLAAKAIVCAGRTLVNLHARVARRGVAALASARTRLEVRRGRGAAQAGVAAAATARYAAAVTRAAPIARAIREELGRAAGEALTAV